MKVVVGSGRGGTSVYTAVGGAREGCDNSVPKARNKCKLSSHIVETNKPERLLRNCVIKLLRVRLYIGNVQVIPYAILDKPGCASVRQLCTLI